MPVQDVIDESSPIMALMQRRLCKQPNRYTVATSLDFPLMVG